MAFLLSLFLLGSSLAAVIRKEFVAKWVPYDPDGYPMAVIGVFDKAQDWPQNATKAPFPGPEIRAVMGDTLEVNFFNELTETEILTVHWHGLHQTRNPWMDGVLGITECGIPSGENFTYKFDLDQSGTYWYHAHSSVQYGNGLLGPLVIEAPASANPWVTKYPYTADYPIILQDWFHERSDDVLLSYSGPTGAIANFTPGFPYPPTAILIHGRGQTDCAVDDCVAAEAQGKLCLRKRDPFFGACNTSAPASEFKCSTEYTRLRVINGASTFALRFWIDQHNLTIIARDGIDMNESVVQFVTIPVGQRLDMMVHCNQDSSKKYNMYAALSPLYVSAGCFITQASSYAFLKYSDGPASSIPTNTPAYPPSTSPLTFGDDMFREYNQKPLKPQVAPAASKRIELRFQPVYGSEVGDPFEHWLVNNISFVPPPVPLLQGVYLDKKFVSKINMSETFTTNVISLRKGETYEFVMINYDVMPHPWHLHGYTVHLLGAGVVEPDLGVSRLRAVPVPVVASCPGNSASTCSASPIANLPCPCYEFDGALYAAFSLTSTSCTGNFSISFVVNSTTVANVPVATGNTTAFVKLGGVPNQNYTVQLTGTCSSGALVSWNGTFLYNQTVAPDMNAVDKFNYSNVQLAPYDSSYSNGTMGDSWTVPPLGYMVFRVVANNPGAWFMHCHMEWHLMQGLAVVISVEDKDGSYDILDPPDNFEVCGDRRRWKEAINLEPTFSAAVLGGAVAGASVGTSLMTMAIQKGIAYAMAKKKEKEKQQGKGGKGGKGGKDKDGKDNDGATEAEAGLGGFSSSIPMMSSASAVGGGGAGGEEET